MDESQSARGVFQTGRSLDRDVEASVADAGRTSRLDNRWSFGPCGRGYEESGNSVLPRLPTVYRPLRTFRISTAPAGRVLPRSHRGHPATLRRESDQSTRGAGGQLPRAANRSEGFAAPGSNRPTPSCLRLPRSHPATRPSREVLRSPSQATFPRKRRMPPCARV